MSAPTFDLGELHGGLRLKGRKKAATASGIHRMPIPKQLILPITQHVGVAANPVVGIGEKVLKGQLIADIDDGLGAPVHATSSGKVVAIEPWPVSRRHGDVAPCIIIETDGEDRAIAAAEAHADFRSMSADALRAHILRGGIVGLGGAVFPTAQKLMQARASNIKVLLINGVECEPYISCDDLLMRESAREILVGAQMMMHALEIEQCIFAVESDKPEALQRLAAELTKLDDRRIVLKQIPTIYPSGGEDQLVQLVANREVPSGGLPTDVGCLVQNVGTAAAICNWVADGEPLLSRITTVTGDGVKQPMNVAVRLGTTVADVIEFAGGYTEDVSTLIIGGPMTGKSMSTDSIPVVKATNCILALQAPPSSGAELACIRCGDCAEVCPVQLQPQQLFWYACSDNEQQLRVHGLTDCIECGCCDLVCPSHIPLTANFRIAKGRMSELADEKARAERARRRFEARNERLQRERRERESQLEEQKQQAKRAGPAEIAEIMKRRSNKDGD
ncbi:MAG: electron transport complex subunit RsxC [Woeseiaceae bacterium]